MKPIHPVTFAVSQADLEKYRGYAKRMAKVVVATGYDRNGMVPRCYGCNQSSGHTPQCEVGVAERFLKREKSRK